MSVMPATATASWAPLERKRFAMIVQKAMSSRFTLPGARAAPDAAKPPRRRCVGSRRPRSPRAASRVAVAAHQKTVMPRMKAIVGSAKLAKKP